VLALASTVVVVPPVLVLASTIETTIVPPVLELPPVPGRDEVETPPVLVAPPAPVDDTVPVVPPVLGGGFPVVSKEQPITIIAATIKRVLSTMVSFLSNKLS
jgi:hypothetical protein